MQEINQTSLLHECRQIMTKRMRSSITGMLNEIDETLLKMAQDRTGNMDESTCYEAVREIRLKRTEIKLRFERRFINLFEKEIKVQNESDNPEQTDNETTKGQFLFNKQNRDESVSMENSVGAVRKSCGQALLDLDKKISSLMGAPHNINPMQPAFIFEAFREACWDIKSGDEIRLMMFRIFERRITDELKVIYEDINRLLEVQKDTENVSPDMESSFAKLPNEDQQSVMLRYEVITRIEKRMAGHDVPEFVRSFLLKHWRIFLENVYTEYSENSIAWNAARQTMDDLIWSVENKSNMYDRQRQVQVLPSLLFRLLNGMKVISMDEADIDKFLKQLKNHQLKSLDKNDSELLDDITEEAIESVSRSTYKDYH
jgi:Protein of unknown function (DUF1631)